jgi:hypothetical protein
MQSRTAVTEVLRGVARQHTRLRGLVCEVAQTSGAERAAAAGWLAHYLVLHAAGERLGLRRESATAAPGVVPARHGPLLGLTPDLGLGLGRGLGLDLDESLTAHRLALLEAAVVRHARAQERVVLPRLLVTWPLADLHRAVATLEAADTVFDHGPSVRAGTAGTTDAVWHTAVAAIERVLAAPAGAKRQAATPPRAMTTAATMATTPTANVTAAVRRT